MAAVEQEIEAILSHYQSAPTILRKGGLPLTAGEQGSLVLRSENYAVESAGLDRLEKLLLGLHSGERVGQFWAIVKKKIHHPLVPWLFISQGKLFQLLEGILDELERQPLDPRLILMASDALKVEHARYSIHELEEIGEMIGCLMTQSQLAGSGLSLSAKQRGEADAAPNYMHAMRAQRDIYKALGTLREVVRGALYQRMEGMLSDS